MLPYRNSPIAQAATVVFFLAVVLYGAYEARAMFFGPSITIDTNTTEVYDQYVLIKGRAEHIAELLINGNPVAITQEGDFAEPYLLAPGSNRITFDAHDKYGTARRRTIDIVYTPAAATSTAAIEAAPVATTSTRSTR